MTHLIFNILVSVSKNFLYYFLTGILPKPSRFTRDVFTINLAFQSGEMARSKYERRQERKKKEINRNIKTMQSKKKAMSKATARISKITGAIHEAQKCLEKMDLHAGFASDESGENLTRSFWDCSGILRWLRNPFERVFVFSYSQWRDGNHILQDIWATRRFEADLRSRIPSPSVFQRIRWFTSFFGHRSTIDNVENVITLCAGLWTSTSMVNAGALVISHLKIYHQASVVETVISYLGEQAIVTESLWDFEHDDLDFQSSLPTNDRSRKRRGRKRRKEYVLQDGDFAEILRGSLKNWKLLKHSKFVKYIISLVAIIVSSTMCTALSLDFNIAGIPLFSEALKKRLDTMNIVDTGEILIEAASYFLDVGYLCFVQKSFKPILYTDAETFAFDQRYIEYVSNYSGAYDSDWDIIGFTESEYIRENEELTQYYTSLYSVIAKGPEKVQIFQRLAQLGKLKMELTRRINSCGMRVSPYVLLIFGSSSVGKTSVASILNTIAIQMCDGTGDPAKRVTFNENDKFFSGYLADTESIISDDICNTNPNFLAESPLANLIKWANNNPELALMADLDSKGKISLRPKTVLLTSNVSDLNASVFSMEPVSILRRLNVHITVKVKEAFSLHNGTGQRMMDPVKANAFVATLKGSDRDLPDLWDITVSRVVTRVSSVAGRPDEGHFEPIFHNNKVMKDISIREAAAFVAHDSRVHKLNQTKIVQGQSSIHERLTVCKECASLTSMCSCGLKMQGGSDEGEEIAKSILHDLNVFVENDKNDEGSGECAESLYYASRHFGTELPAPVERRGWEISLRSVASFCVFPIWLFSWSYMSLSLMIWFAGVMTCVLCCLPTLTFLYKRLMWWYRLYKYGVRYSRFITCVGRDIRTHAAELERYMTQTREGRIYLTGTLTFFSTWMIYKLVKIILGGRKLYRKQSELNPDAAEYKLRRNTPSYWAVPTSKPCRGSHQSSTSTWQDLAAIRERNQVFVKWGKKICGGFMVKTHFMLLPNHFLSEDAELHIKVNTTHGNNEHFCRCQVSLSNSFHIPGTDLRMWYVPTGGDFRDMSSYFPDELVKQSWGSRFAYRDQDGEVIRDTTRCEPSDINVQGIQYPGLKYTLSSLVTFRGMCMASLVNEGKQPKIIGFHLGGVTDTSHGAAGSVTSSQINHALGQLNRVGILELASSAEIREDSFIDRLGGLPYLFQGNIKPQCPTNFLPEGACVEVIGSCSGGATRSSQVITSHISDSVTEFFGVERLHDKAPLGPPLVPKWHPWQLGMQGFSTISPGPLSGVLCRAAADYLSFLKSIAAPEKPLDLDTIVNGWDNDKFINRMPQGTSVGFPLSGSLSKVCKLQQPTEGHACNYALDDDILDEFVHCEDVLRSGHRINSIFRAALKDEPRPIGSTKARVFQAAPLVLKMLLRKYFLPLVARLSMFPLISECAVGVNPFSGEWDEMHRHIGSKGEDRIVAGDYSAYDQRMSPALTSAVFDILIRFATLCNYTEDNIIVMKALATEVIYPLVAYDGTLIKLFGSNPSGHNLTVYVNSIANSLISRCAFFTIYPREMIFKRAVSMMTYGDDDIGSVDTLYPLFNNISKSEYITSIGMKYTPPSKSGEHVEYMMMEEVDFLKRKSIYNEKKGRFMGALELSSIYKSLHCRMKSTEISDSQWAASVCDAALREAFPHGKDYYVDMQRGLASIADRHDFSHHCVNLMNTYEECSEKIG